MGGFRKGSGRPVGSGRFGERSVQLRVPKSMVPQISEMLAQAAIKAAATKPIKRAKKVKAIALPTPGKVLLEGPIDAMAQMARLKEAGVHAAVVILDPDYRVNKKHKPLGRAHYLAEAIPLISLAGEIADHVIIWGFPMSVARLVDHQPPHLVVEGWISWIYSNSVSKKRSWRGAQQVALHFRRPRAKLYYESFLTESAREAHSRNKLPLIITQRDVVITEGDAEDNSEQGLIIKEPLSKGFIRRSEQTEFEGGQKPLSVFTPLIQMTAKAGDLIIDPTAGSGTTGMVAAKLGCRAILSDREPASLKIARKRLAPYLSE